MNLKFEFLADKQEAIPLVAKWYFDEWGHKVTDNSIEQTIDRLNRQLDRHKLPLPILAIEDKKIVGVARLKLHEMDIYPDKQYWLGSLFVETESRGKGIGAALADRIVTIAADFGAEELYLQTEALDGGLYRRLGWRSIEIVCYKGLDVNVMVKELAKK